MFAPTRNRSLLGTINDFAFAIQHRLHREPTSLDELAIWLADTPIHTRFHDGTGRALLARRCRSPDGGVPGTPPPARASTVSLSRGVLAPADLPGLELQLETLWL